MSGVNLRLFEWFFGFAHRGGLTDGLIIFFTTYLPYLMGLGVLVFLFREKNVRRRWFIFIALTLAVLLSRGILTPGVRFFYPHPRPFDAMSITALIPESGPSLPSGHATFFFALGGMLYWFSRRWGSTYIALAVLIGAARVMAGVHWPADILAGAAIGLLSAWFISYLLASYKRELFSEAPSTLNAP